MAQAWVALTPIWHGFVRAFNTGDVVPDSVEAKWDYAGQGLVARADVEGNPFPGIDETGVAFRRDVVLKTDLYVAPTPPVGPAIGTVWIDNSV